MRGKKVSLRPLRQEHAPGRTQYCSAGFATPCPPSCNVLALLWCRLPVRFSGTVLSLQGPPVGQLPCPGRTCASTRPPLRALPRARSSGSKYASPHDRPVHPLSHNVRHPRWRPAFIFDMASAPLPPNNQGRARLAVRRPPSSAFPRPALGATWRRWRFPPARPHRRPSSLPARRPPKTKPYQTLLTTDQKAFE